jgi:hypothetical protein
MTRPEDELALKKALAENGSFDPQKAEELKRKAVGAFEAKMRKTERIYFVNMCVVSWLLVFALFYFLQASTTKAIITSGLLALVFFEATILLKLWYWIMNNKISVLKAIKQIEVGGSATGDDDTFGAGRKLEGPLKGLSSRERAVWTVALIAGCVLVVAVKAPNAPSWTGPCILTSNTCVTLAADGSGSTVTDQSFINEGMDPTQRTFNYYSPKSHPVRFTDGSGRELPVTTSVEGDHVRYNVTLPHRIGPGQRFGYIQISKGPGLARREGDTWVYSSGQTPGCDTNEMSDTVVLPEGAQIISAEPWPVAQFTLGGKTGVRFQAIRGLSESFKYTVRYRLAAEKAERDAGQ